MRDGEESYAMRKVSVQQEDTIIINIWGDKGIALPSEEFQLINAERARHGGVRLQSLYLGDRKIAGSKLDSAT